MQCFAVLLGWWGLVDRYFEVCLSHCRLMSGGTVSPAKGLWDGHVVWAHLQRVNALPNQEHVSLRVSSLASALSTMHIATG